MSLVSLASRHIERSLRRTSWLVAALALVGASTLASQAVAGSPEGQPVATVPTVEASTDRYIIKLRDPSADLGARLTSMASVAGTTFTYVRAMSGGAHVVRMGTKLSMSGARSMAQQLMLDPQIAYIEPDRKMYPLLVPNDSLYASNQWNLFESIGGINAPAAWDITTGSTSVVMAVVDTGYRPHVDLTGRFLPGYDFIDDVPTANDGNGRDADATDPGDYGCPGSTNSSSWHGTHVSGIAGAASNNGVGVAGVNWVSKILPVRVLGVCGGYTSDIVDGMRWAAGIAVTGVPANTTPRACSTSASAARTLAAAPSRARSTTSSRAVRWWWWPRATRTPTSPASSRPAAAT